MIYITGDTHGDRKRLSRFNLRQLKEGDTLIICGDFGFMWNDTKQERDFLMNLGKRKYNICFIDGTHENFEILNNLIFLRERLRPYVSMQMQAASEEGYPVMRPMFFG